MYKIKTFCSRYAASYLLHTAHHYQDSTRYYPRQQGHAPHLRMELRRIFWRCTNIPEYINLGPYAKLSQCAASTYSMRCILPQTETINTPKSDEFCVQDTIRTSTKPETNSDVLAAQDTP